MMEENTAGAGGGGEAAYATLPDARAMRAACRALATLGPRGRLCFKPDGVSLGVGDGSAFAELSVTAASLREYRRGPSAAEGEPLWADVDMKCLVRALARADNGDEVSLAAESRCAAGDAMCEDGAQNLAGDTGDGFAVCVCVHVTSVYGKVRLPITLSPTAGSMHVPPSAAAGIAVTTYVHLWHRELNKLHAAAGFSRDPATADRDDAVWVRAEEDRLVLETTNGCAELPVLPADTEGVRCGAPVRQRLSLRRMYGVRLCAHASSGDEMLVQLALNAPARLSYILKGGIVVVLYVVPQSDR